MKVSQEGKEWIAALEAQERKRTGIASLKVGYNRVFGYYLEISKSNLHLVPQHYQRKQTLVNGERFLTPELKEYETLVLEAEEKRWQLEIQLFQEIRSQVPGETSRMQKTAQTVSELDVLAAPCPRWPRKTVTEAAAERGRGHLPQGKPASGYRKQSAGPAFCPQFHCPGQ